GNDRQQRVEDERHDGGARADAADVGDRDQEPEQRQTGNRLQQVGDAEDPPAGDATAKREDAERYTSRDGRQGRNHDETRVLERQAQRLRPVVPQEREEAHQFSDVPSVRAKARASGSLDPRRSRGEPRNTRPPAASSAIRSASARSEERRVGKGGRA